MSKNHPALWLAVALTLLLGACGQKGPLYLPDREPARTEKQKS
ncbi:LPS translocon maturation chaperone LptM [Methylococcus mesophilus]|jgi:predicted small lipoprotein YifL|nr:lipoprotein [Methylococcus mesophilus]UZR30256.1 lipoprotein [Methylococcus mesophilus]